MQVHTTRIVRKLTALELKKLNRAFGMYGAKSDFERIAKYSRITATRILKNGRGYDRIVEKMLEYADSKS